ncbi:hypothetical protein [Kitasatospora purpeofusca]|uniref:hypothetical protein n=1 Tax=Kitasatospora purpeofusca TaxID=67352 RepID=UPI0038155D0A
MRVGHPEQDTTAIDSTSASRLLDGLARTGSTTALRAALPDALPWSPRRTWTCSSASW